MVSHVRAVHECQWRAWRWHTHERHTGRLSDAAAHACLQATACLSQYPPSSVGCTCPMSGKKYNSDVSAWGCDCQPAMRSHELPAGRWAGGWAMCSLGTTCHACTYHLITSPDTITTHHTSGCSGLHMHPLHMQRATSGCTAFILAATHVLTASSSRYPTKAWHVCAADAQQGRLRHISGQFMVRIMASRYRRQSGRLPVQRNSRTMVLISPLASAPVLVAQRSQLAHTHGHMCTFRYVSNTAATPAIDCNQPWVRAGTPACRS